MGRVGELSAPQQIDSFAGRQAKPTKLDRSKCEVARWLDANSSQLSVARSDTAPTCQNNNGVWTGTPPRPRSSAPDL
jgi:hypothetical protein